MAISLTGRDGRNDFTDALRKRSGKRQSVRILVGIVAVLLILIAVVVEIGYALPVKHRAPRMRIVPAPADTIHAFISNTSAFPQ